MKKSNFIGALLLCIALLAGCLSGQEAVGTTVPVATQPSVTEPYAVESFATTPSETESVGTIPVLKLDDPVVQIYDRFDDTNQELTFQLEDHPGMEFVMDQWGWMYSIENGQRRELFGQHTGPYAIFLADVSGDGVRDFCWTYYLGNQSDRRLMVWDATENRYYLLREPRSYDYYLRIEEGELAVYRSPHKRGWFKDAEFVPTQEDQRGRVVLEDARITFTAGETVVQGECISPRFNEEALAGMIADIQAYMLEEREYTQTAWISPTEELLVFIEKSGIDFGDSITVGDGYIEIQYTWIDDNMETMVYMLVLQRVTAGDWGYYELDQYQYLDPEDPMQLIICTEGRDLGYLQPEDYFAAVTAGACEHHEDTFIIRLDSCAIYRMGSEDDLFEKLCG